MLTTVEVLSSASASAETYSPEAASAALRSTYACMPEAWTSAGIAANCARAERFWWMRMRYFIGCSLVLGPPG